MKLGKELRVKYDFLSLYCSLNNKHGYIAIGYRMVSVILL